MIKRFSPILCAAGITLSCGSDEGPVVTPPQDFALVWSDEFNGEAGRSPDPDRWTFDIGTGPNGDGYGNNQLEYTTDLPRNVSLDGDGHLAIVAIQEPFLGRSYTAGRITTKDQFATRYGRIEARIRLPVGRGIWPAFWMLGDTFPQVAWPQPGEIDIMEYRGQDRFAVLGSLHGPGYCGAPSLCPDQGALGQTFRLPDGAAGFDEEFHVFAVEWDASRISWFVDDQVYSTITASEIVPDVGDWVFTQPFFLLLNLAVGGNFVGDVGADTVFPQTMLVDYVRVFKRVRGASEPVVVVDVDDGAAQPNPTPGAIAITPATSTIAVGGNQQLHVTGTLADGSTAELGASVGWRSSQPDIVAVGGSGVVYGLALGEATVTATVNDIVDSIVVTVTDGNPPPPTGIPLPMVVDENYEGRSGFGDGGPPLHLEDNNCPSRAGGQAGVCHRFTWDGTGGSFTGTFWTDGGGFADLNSKVIQPGATDVSFYAWGANGGEVIEFGAGIPDAVFDGAADRIFITLTTTPTRYTVPLTNLAGYTDVFGPFIWSAGATDNPDGIEFFIDDIQWIEETVQPPSGIALPMVVDDNYEGRSGFSESGPPLHAEDNDCPRRVGEQAGQCHRFTWDGTGGGFTGTFWTDGDGFTDLNSKAIQPGATEVSFYAWGANGGEVIEFGAGIPDAVFDGAADRVFITLTATPTAYAVRLSNLANYSAVYGPFIWAASSGNNPTGVEFFIDDIQWVQRAPQVELRPDPADVVIAYAGGPPTLRDPATGGANVGDAEGGSSYVIPFALPSLPDGGFSEANLRINVIAIAGDGSGVDLHADLYGLPFRTAAEVASNDVVLASMFHADVTPDAAATLLVDNLLTGTTPGANTPLETEPSGDQAIVDYLNAQVTAGASAGDYIYLRLSPDAVPSIEAGYTWVISAAVDANAPPDRPSLTIR